MNEGEVLIDQREVFHTLIFRSSLTPTARSSSPVISLTILELFLSVACRVLCLRCNQGSERTRLYGKDVHDSTRLMLMRESERGRE